MLHASVQTRKYRARKHGKHEKHVAPADNPRTERGSAEPC